MNFLKTWNWHTSFCVRWAIIAIVILVVFTGYAMIHEALKNFVVPEWVVPTIAVTSMVGFFSFLICAMFFSENKNERH
jgi:divalent metal cation (Fe/Co/Zn/Cd) transporter